MTHRTTSERASVATKQAVNFALAWETAQLWVRWAGKYHRTRYSGSQGEKLLGWNLVSWCGAWENLHRANRHHQRAVRGRVRLADRPRRRDRCENCITHESPSRDSGWSAKWSLAEEL